MVRASTTPGTRDVAAPATGPPKEQHLHAPGSSQPKQRSHPLSSPGSAGRKPAKWGSEVPNPASTVPGPAAAAGGCRGGERGRRPVSPLSPRPHPPVAGRGGLRRLQHQLFQGLCSLCGALGLAQAATNAKSSPLCHLPHPAACTGVTLCAPGRTGQPLCLSTRSSPCC